MGTPYTGQPTATRPPAPQPGPGTILVVTLPVDGDPDAGATYAQAFESITDAISYLSKTLQCGLPSTSSALPQIRLLDASGNGRFVFDHNGYPMGGRTGFFDEEWLANPGSGASVWSAAGGTGGSVLTHDPTSTYNARYIQLTPSSTSSLSYSATAPRLIWGAATYLAVAMEFEVGLNAAAGGTSSNTSFWFGLSDLNDPAGSNPNMIAIKKPFGSTSWWSVQSGGGIPNVNSLSTAASTGSNPIDRIKIELFGSAVPGGARGIISINEVQTVLTGTLPGAAGLQPIIGCNNENGTPSGSPVAYISPIRICWNRFLSGPNL